jgi:8-oxo-dGTP pyrophosphatase MutT (NUDIX family)
MSSSPIEPGEHAGGPAPWPRNSSQAGPNLLVCRARFDRVINPRTGKELVRTVLETPDWVNVVALTPERRLVVVRQYRFGTASITTEIPGGMVDPGETSAEAARRELREEAGHTAERWTYLGAVEPNPAFHDNLCHHWLAEEARPTHDQELDEGEDIEVLTLGLDEARSMIESGAIRHALVITALSKVMALVPSPASAGTHPPPTRPPEDRARRRK